MSSKLQRHSADNLLVTLIPNVEAMEVKKILKSPYFAPTLVLLLGSLWLFPFGVQGIIHQGLIPGIPKLIEKCKTDSIFNYFPKSSVESVFGYKVAGTIGNGLDNCNGGEITFKLTVWTTSDLPPEIKEGIEFWNSIEPGTIGQETGCCNISVRIRKASTPQSAHDFYQEETYGSGLNLPPGGFSEKIKELRGEAEEYLSPLGIGDESVLIDIKSGVVRKGQYIYTVEADSGFLLIPEFGVGKESPSSLASKIKKLLVSAINRKPGAYVEPGVNTEEFSKLPKTCGEYIDYPKLFESIMISGDERDKPPSFSPGLPIVKTDGDKYFPAKRIEAIWGKNTFFTQYGDKKLSAGLAQSLTKQEQELKKLSDRLPKELKLPSQFSITDKSSLTAFLSPGAVDWVSCLVAFSASNPVLNSVTLSYIKFNSEQNALNSINLTENQKKELKQQGTVINKVKGSKKIGDGYSYMEGTLLAEGQKESLSFFAVAAVKGKFQAGVLFFNQSDLNKADETLRMILGNLTGEAEEDRGESQKELGPPVITKLTPATVPAGIEKDVNELDGFADYEDYLGVLEITGENLRGAQLSSNNIGLDGKAGIEFKDVKVINNHKAFAQIIAHPTASETTEDKQTLITLTNESGRSTTYPLKVTIAGTQYLKRRFAKDPVAFFGSWKELAPNERVIRLEDEIRRGLDRINIKSYQELQIIQYIYEPESWAYSGCPPVMTIGCAGPKDNKIYIKEHYTGLTTPSYTIIHEAAHKLHFYYTKLYRGAPNLFPPESKFETEWVETASISDYKDCPFLPLTQRFEWKDGTFSVPHCGFIKSYGASNLVFFYEDVATMAEGHFYPPDYLNAAEIKTDPRYSKKFNLLKKYEFVQ